MIEVVVLYCPIDSIQRSDASRPPNGHQGPLVVVMMPSTRSLAFKALCGDPIVRTHHTHPKSLFSC